MENVLGYTTHRKKLLDFIVTALKQNIGNEYTKINSDYSIQDVMNDFVYCMNNGNFEIVLDGKEINPKRLSYFSVSEGNKDSWIFTLPFNNKDIELRIDFQTNNTQFSAEYTITTNDSALNQNIIGREIAIYSHVEDKLLFDNKISFIWNETAKGYVSDINIKDLYTGGLYTIEFDGVRYSDLKVLPLKENSYFLGGGESWDNACQKVELIGGNSVDGYIDIHSALLLISPDIYRYDELHSLKVWEIREFVTQIDEKFIPDKKEFNDTTKFKNVIVSGDSVINHLDVEDSCTVPMPTGNNDAANKLYVDSAKDYILLKAPNSTDIYKISVNESGALATSLYTEG